MTDAEFCAPHRPVITRERKPRRVHAPEYLPWGKRRANPTPRKERAELPRAKRGEQKLSQREVRARIAAFKLERGCADCGYKAHAAALEFDHIRGQKAVNLSQISVSHWSVAEHEIAKCEVVCANCHRIRHATKRRGLQ